MKRGLLIFILALLPFTLTAPCPVSAEIEWNVKKQLKLEAAPVDVVPSIDGKWIYVLIDGEIAVYSTSDYKVLNRIPVGKNFDRLAYSPADNALIASSSRKKTVKIIQLEVVHAFSLDGLPYLGAANAGVTLVVFSDYQ